MNARNGVEVSVVVPVHNEAALLRVLLPELENQSLGNDRYEVIVVDNQSTDESRRVVEAYESKYDGILRLVREDEVQSAYAARNRGVEASNGEIIAFTDADCRPRERWLEHGCRTLRQENAQIAAGAIHVTVSDNPGIWETIDSVTYLNQKHYVEEGGWGATANLFVRRSCFESHGFFDATLQSGGDCEFGRRLTTNGVALVYAGQAVVNHPARSTLLDLVRARYRTGKGLGKLRSRNQLSWDPLMWKEFLPVLDHPELTERANSVVELLGLIGGFNLIRLVNVMGRIVGFLEAKVVDGA